jgi:hypothetical protein
MMRNLTPTYLTSSNIDAVGYEHETKRLFIRFNSGESYSYSDVGFTQFDALTKVESAGKFFHQHIRGKYVYNRLDFDPFTGEQRRAAA